MKYTGWIAGLYKVKCRGRGEYHINLTKKEVEALVSIQNKGGLEIEELEYIREVY